MTEHRPWPKLRLRNPFVFRFTQFMTGVGVGCGVGVGIGVPVPMGALGPTLPLGEINRYINQGRRFVRPFIKKLGIQRLDAGIGCGVGVGHGFGVVGLALKPGVAEEVFQFAQDGFKALMSRLPQAQASSELASLTVVEDKVGIPHHFGLHQTPSVPGLPSAPGLGTMLGNRTDATGTNAFQILPQMQQQQKQQQSEEMERLKLDKEVLQTLLRQQRQIDDLRDELKTLQAVSKTAATPTRDMATAPQSVEQCFDCRRKLRRHH